MFALSKVKAKLNSAHVSPERHGEETVPAQYLTIEVDMPNTILNQFDKGLLPAFYGPADQASIDGSLPCLKFPDLQSDQKWKYEGIGYRLEIDHGIDESSAIVLPACKVDKTNFSLKEGGTVKLGFRISTKTDELTSGQLDHMQQQEITMTLTPPTAEDLAALNAASKKGTQEKLV